MQTLCYKKHLRPNQIDETRKLFKNAMEESDFIKESYVTISQWINLLKN